MARRRKDTKKHDEKVIYEIACGLDVHKELIASYAVFGEMGREAPEEVTEVLNRANRAFRRFPATVEGIRGYVGFFDERFHINVLIENSTKSHPVYHCFKSLGIDITMAHSTDLDRITKSTRKNDDHDAKELAGYMRRKLNGEVEFAECFVPDAVWENRRSLCRNLASAHIDVSSQKRRIRNHLMIQGIALSKGYGNITSRTALEEMIGLNNNVMDTDAVRASNLSKEIRLCEKKLDDELKDVREYQIIRSIPGFGILSAAYLVCMVVDFGRFPTARDLGGYLGMRPKQDDSADSQKDLPITHRGDKVCRTLICQAAFVHATHYPDTVVGKRYRRMKANKKHQKSAMVAAGNAMLLLVMSLIRDDRLFDINYSRYVPNDTVPDSTDDLDIGFGTEDIEETEDII